MCIATDQTIDQHLREQFETVLPSGAVSPASVMVADAGTGVLVVMPGHVDPETFAQEASALIELATDRGHPLGRHSLPILTSEVEVLPALVMPSAGEHPHLDWDVDAKDPRAIQFTVVVRDLHGSAL